MKINRRDFDVDSDVDSDVDMYALVVCNNALTDLRNLRFVCCLFTLAGIGPPEFSFYRFL